MVHVLFCCYLYARYASVNANFAVSKTYLDELMSNSVICTIKGNNKKNANNEQLFQICISQFIAISAVIVQNTLIFLIKTYKYRLPEKRET